uniref:Ig-like domain-containing protein n=1 Tax=Salvator merianae TaxID=96440 RepID=A0A8D0CEU8_SALMN
MAWTLLFLAFLHCCAGVSSQATLTQPASKSASLGQTVKLSCSRSSGSWDSFSWYQQKPGKAPRLLIYDDSDRATGVPDRFTGSESGDIGYLTISNTQAEDEADYYCAAWELDSSTFHSDTIWWGSETKTFPFLHRTKALALL